MILLNNHKQLAIGRTAPSALPGPHQLAFTSGATAGSSSSASATTSDVPTLPHFTAKAKRALCVVQSLATSLVIAIAPMPARADRLDDFKKLEAECADADNKFSEERSEVKPPPDAYFIRRVD